MSASYLQPDVIARAEALGLKARSLVEGLRVGEHKSPYRGFSVEFVQHREYVPGDDTRHIDWKVYGRSGRYSIKQYEQETNYIGHILLDGSRSMLYGEGEGNKLEYAKLLAATISYLIIHQRDSAALNVFDSAWRTQIPASGQPGQLQTILRTLESTQPREKTSIGPLLHLLSEKIRRRGLVFLLSDCFDDVESLIGGVRHLRFRGHEVVVFHIMHPDELDLPFDGNVRFEGLEEAEHYLTRPQQIRDTYRRHVVTFLEELRRGCEIHHVDYLLMNTGQPLAGTLAEYLARRQRVRRV
jgi:uncharacterized protein (DUF58 family)